jgi:murein DD-endopeptidase MepM/ murein hydrolase activator NlpD
VTPAVKAAVVGVAAVALCAPMLPVLILTASAPSAGAGASAITYATNVTLNVDALPDHARGWATWLLAGGTRCPDVKAPLLAAQIDQESGWNPAKVTARAAGGDAKGLAQLTDIQWQSWGADADANGTSSPLDPPDAITALAKAMCELTAWTTAGVDDKVLTGDVLDLALAAYTCGRPCVLAAGGVPAAGYAHDYPSLVRSRIAKYSLGPLVTGGWTRPLPVGKYVVGSPFGPRDGRLHAGVDLMVPTGTPVYAAADGVILQAECDSAYCDRPGNPGLPGCGNMVDVQHAGGIATRYCHLVAFAPGIQGARGLQVRAGQLIGLSGSTGHSSGPHLHYEVHLHAPPVNNDTAVDPVVFMRAIGLPL